MTTRRTRLEIRLDADLKAQIEAAAKAANEDMSDFVRTALKHALREYRAPSQADLVRFNHLCREIDGAATNINQLARAANQARLGHGTAPDIATVEAAAARVERLGREVLAIMKQWI